MYAHIISTIVAFSLTVFIAFPARELWFQRNFRNGRRIHKTFVIIGSAIVLAHIFLIFTARESILTDALHGFIYASLGYLIFLVGRQKIRSIRASKQVRILAIGAHPDDLEIACGGTLSKLADAGHVVHAIVMCDGQVGGNASVRPDEAKNGARFMGVSDIEVHTFTDTHLAQHEVELVQVIERKIDEFAPDVIFTHSKNDQHQDHQAVHFATLRAARRHPSVLCYESPSTTRDFDPSFFVDLSDYVDVKVSAVAQHKDQLTKPYMGPDHIKGIAAFRRSQAKMQFAEGFEIVRLVDSSLAGI